jgi:hypothetical protein
MHAVAPTAALTLAALWTMVYAGMRKHRLVRRRPWRRCPACGVVITGRTCRRH